jgi:hypothetical protein
MPVPVRAGRRRPFAGTVNQLLLREMQLSAEAAGELVGLLVPRRW